MKRLGGGDGEKRGGALSHCSSREQVKKWGPGEEGGGTLSVCSSGEQVKEWWGAGRGGGGSVRL